MFRTRFKPVEGETYINRNGGAYKCVGSIHETPYCVGPAYSARLVNLASGWELTANGLIMYPDGTIEWDYSSNGRFAGVPE